MKEVPLQEWAKRLLEDQIERLGELRNANPRDQSFKLWRQTTLTVIQRLWPGNLPKSEQFRRIAFTTPSARATRNQVRQHYERGCAEAVGYLRMMMMEIDAGALSLSADAEPLEATAEALSPPVVPDSPQEAVRDTRGLDEGLVGSGPLSPGNPELVTTGPPLQFTSPAFDRDPEFRTPVPGQESRDGSAVSSSAAPTPDPAPPVAPAPIAPQAPPSPKASTRPAPLVVKARGPLPPAPRPAAPAPPPPAKPVAPPSPPAAPAPTPVATPAEMSADGSHAPRRTDKRPLKEMLGFVDAPASPARGPASPPSPVAATPPGPGWFEPPQQADDSLEEPETDPFEHDDEEEPDESPHTPFKASDLLGAPGIGGSARASVPAPRAATPSSGSALSAVLNALAADVTRLGVPEGQRAATRAALIGLGRQFDLGTANWSSVRQTIVMVLEYPALARLLIPALVPYLNLE